MKNIILVFATVFSLSSAMAQNAKGGGGQPKSTPEQRAQKSTDNLDKAVTLAADQKTQVYNLALTRSQKVDAIRAKYKGQPEQKETAKTEIKAAHKEYAKAVKPLLTADQIAKLKAQHKERKAARGNKGGKTNKVQSDTTVTEEDVEELIPAED